VSCVKLLTEMTNFVEKYMWGLFDKKKTLERLKMKNRHGIFKATKILFNYMCVMYMYTINLI